MLEGVFEPLFAAYPDGLLVADASGHILLANPEACRLLGYSATQLLALNVDALVPGRVRAHHAALRQGFARQPAARPMGTQTELAALRADGSEVMVEIALSPLQHQGQALVVAALRSIGDYPRVKQAIQRGRYGQAMAEAATLAGQAEDLQPLAQGVADLAAAALQAQSCAVYLLPSGAANGRPQLAALAGPQPLESPVAAVAKATALALDEPMHALGHTLGLLSLRWPSALPRGVEEQRFVQSLAGLLASSVQRLQAQEQLLHAQKLESVGQLTGGIAHDFNNLLTVIMGNLQVLEERAASRGNADALDATGASTDAAMLAAATRAAKRGAELTSRLLAFSRRQVLQPSAVDVAAMLQGMAALLRRTLDASIHIACDLPPDSTPGLRCWADAAQLESALLNLAINARDAMPEGGKLSFGARSIEQAPAALAATDLGPGPFVALSVADSGSGMSEAVLARAFEPFFTTKPSGRGTGLGLATVYGFARQSKGGAFIESRPGQGTVVTLLLPQHLVAATSAAAALEAAQQPLPPGFSVLVVEDDADVQAVVRRLLQAMGAKVEVVGHAQAAWQRLQANATLPSLLLSDIALGAGERGTTLAQRVHRRWPQLPVLLMTGYASDALHDDQRWPVLRKPLDALALRTAIAALVPRSG